MKNLITLLAFISALFPVFGQQESYVEVDVYEEIEIEVKDFQIKFQISATDVEYNMNYDYEIFYTETDGLLDASYEESLAYDPNSITREMRKEYEQRQKKKEKDRLESKKRYETNMEQSKHACTKLMQILKSNNFPYTIEIHTNSDYTYEEAELIGSSLDTAILVKVTGKEMFLKVLQLTHREPFRIYAKNGELESMEEIWTEMIPIMTEKAQIQAELLAKSMKRKLGKILSISTLAPQINYTEAVYSYDDYPNVSDSEYYLIDEYQDFGPQVEHNQTITLAYRYRFLVMD